MFATPIKELLFACSFLDDSDDDELAVGPSKASAASLLKTSEGRARFASFSHTVSIFSDERALDLFGFTAPHIHRLAKALRLPSPFPACRPFPISSLEALSVTLYLVRNPSRSIDSNFSNPEKDDVFELLKQDVCFIAQMVLPWIEDRWGGLIEFDPVFLREEKLEEYCLTVKKKMKKSVRGKGNIWGFVGTSSWEMQEFEGKRKVKKKGVEQLLHKSLQCQTLLLLNGLFASVSGGWRPSFSPSTIFSLSGLRKHLLKDSLRHKPLNVKVCLSVYSNTGSGVSPVHLGPSERKSHGTMDRTEELANNEMENMRRYVDLEMEEMGKVWCLLRDRNNTMIDFARNSLVFFGAVLFQNAKCCLSPTGNETSQFFKASPPSLEEYFHNEAPIPRLFRGIVKEAPERLL